MPSLLRSAKLALAATILAAVSTSTAPALADARTEARKHFREGMSLIARGEYERGVAELEKANEILPHPSVTFNIARAWAEAGKLDKAIVAYRDYLASEPPDRAEVAVVLRELEDKQRASEALARAEVRRPQAKPPEPPGETPPAAPEPTAPPPPTKPARPPRPTEQIVGAARTEGVYEETVVTASRGAQSPLEAPSSTTILTRQDVRLSGITKIPELLRRVAGADVMQITGGDTNVSLRGFNGRLSNKILVLVNGRSVQNDILGSTFWDSLTIDVDQIERIEVVRGPGSALYGADAFAGVVNIITMAPGEGTTGARAGWGEGNEAYGSLWATGREGDLSWRASAGYTRRPRWTREVAADRVDTHTTDIDQELGADNVRIDLRTAQRLARSTVVELGGGFARSNLDIYGIGPFNDFIVRADQGDVTAALRTRHLRLRTYLSRIVATASQNAAYLGQPLYETEPVQDVLDSEIELVEEGPLPASLHHDLHVGVGYRLKHVAWSYLQDDVPIEHHGSVYAQDALRFGRGLTVVASGRLDYVPQLKRVVPSPRGSVLIHPTDRQTIRLAGATAFRSPTFLESYLDLPIQLPLPGLEFVSASKRREDPEFVLDPEQIVTAEIGYQNRQSDLFEVEATAYYERVTDLIELAPARPVTLSNRGAGIGGLDDETGRFAVAFGGWDNRCDTTHVIGGELGTRVYPVEGLDLFANYSPSWSTQQRPQGCTVPDDERTSRHKVNAGVQVRTRPGIDGEITFHYQSSQVWTEQVATLDGIVYQSFSLPALSLLNGRVGYRFLHDRAEAAVVVFNALAGVVGDEPQMHPFGNRIGRRVMGFLSYTLGGRK